MSLTPDSFFKSLRGFQQELTLTCHNPSSFHNPLDNPCSSSSSYTPMNTRIVVMRMRLLKHKVEGDPHQLNQRQIIFLKDIEPFLERSNTFCLTVFKILLLTLIDYFNCDSNFKMSIKVGSQNKEIEVSRKKISPIRTAIFFTVMELWSVSDYYLSIDKEKQDRLESCVAKLNRVEECLKGHPICQSLPIHSLVSKVIALLRTAFSKDPTSQADNFDLLPILFSPADNLMRVLHNPKVTISYHLNFRESDLGILKSLLAAPLLFFQLCLDTEYMDLDCHVEQPGLNQELSAILAEPKRFPFEQHLNFSLLDQIRQMLLPPNRDKSFDNPKFLGEFLLTLEQALRLLTEFSENRDRLSELMGNYFSTLLKTKKDLGDIVRASVLASLESDIFLKRIVTNYIAKLKAVASFLKVLLEKNQICSSYVTYFDISVPFEEGIRFKSQQEMMLFAFAVRYNIYFKSHPHESNPLDILYQKIELDPQNPPNPELNPLFFFSDPISKDHRFIDNEQALKLRGLTGDDGSFDQSLLSFFSKRVKLFFDVFEQSPLDEEEKRALFETFSHYTMNPDWSREDLVIFSKKIQKRLEKSEEIILEKSVVDPNKFFIEALILYFFAPFQRLILINNLLIAGEETQQIPKQKSPSRNSPCHEVHHESAVAMAHELKETPEIHGLEADASDKKEPANLSGLQELMHRIGLNNEPNFYVICQIIQNQGFSKLGHSTYRELFCSIRGWIERMLKIYHKDHKGHDLYDLYLLLPAHLFEQPGTKHLNRKDIRDLFDLSGLYRFYWDLNEPVTESMHQLLTNWRQPADDLEKPFKDLFFSYMNLAIKILKIVSGKNTLSEFKLKMPEVQHSQKIQPTGFLLRLLELSNTLSSKPLKDCGEEIPLETKIEKNNRLRKIRSIDKKIQYHIEGLQELLIAHENADEVSYVRCRHILFCFSHLLESAIDLTLFSSNLQGASGKHVVFELLPSNRMLGFSHDIEKKFQYLPASVQACFSDDSHVRCIKQLSNYTNSVYYFQDVSTCSLISYLNRVKEHDGYIDTQIVAACKKDIIEMIEPLFEIVNQLIIQHLAS